MIENELRQGVVANWLPMKTSLDSNSREVEEYVHMECRTAKGTEFKFLPFISGKISWIYSAGKDVLSGPFSGCIMGAYIEGGRKICHVATDKVNKWDRKDDWNRKKENVKVEAEFKPFDSSFHQVLLNAYRNTSGPADRVSGYTNYGLITAGGKCFTIMTYTATKKVFKIGIHSQM